MERRQMERAEGEPDYSEERSLINHNTSLLVTLPRGFVKEHGLEKGQNIVVEKHGDRCVIRPE